MCVDVRIQERDDVGPRSQIGRVGSVDVDGPSFKTDGEDETGIDRRDGMKESQVRRFVSRKQQEKRLSLHTYL